MSKTILVLGATGTLGQPVAHALKETGYTVRLLARNTEKARRIFGNGFEIIAGSATNTDDLQAALPGCAGVHVSLPSESELEAVKHIVALATQNNLERITYVSATTVTEANKWFELIAVKLRAEEIIRSSSLPYTIFCPTWVMEVLPNFVHGHRATAIVGKQPIPLHFFAAEDFGRMAAAAYGMPETIGKRLYIHGPEAIPLQEAIERFVAACHPEIKKITTMPVWLARALAMLTRKKDLNAASRLIGYFDKVGEIGHPGEANDLLGAPGITLDAWLSKRSASSRKNLQQNDKQ